MTTQFIEITILAWIGYNIWRVASAHGNAIEISAEAIAVSPLQFSYETYMKVREFYLELSTAHKKYDVRESSNKDDDFIDVWETAGFQFVKHRYRIAEIVPEKRMRLVSEQSEVTIFGVLRSHTRSEVEFRFGDAPGTTTKLGLTIRIVFPNRIRQLLARVFFTEFIWQAHAREEMTALARLIKTRYSSNPVLS